MGVSYEMTRDNGYKVSLGHVELASSICFICRIDGPEAHGYYSSEELLAGQVIVESDSSEMVQLVNGFPEVDRPILQLLMEYCKRLHRRPMVAAILDLRL